MKVPGIGKAISGKIREYVTTGEVAAYERLKAEFPEHEGVPAKLAVPPQGGQSH
jgi:DNA polymerase/3'-5' exonuclease PolX